MNKSLIVITALFLGISAFGQQTGSKVIQDVEADPAYEKLKEQYREESKKFSTLASDLENLIIERFDPNSEESLNNSISVNQSIIHKINSSTIHGVCSKLDQLQQSLTGRDSDHCSMIKLKREKAEDAIDEARAALNKNQKEANAVRQSKIEHEEEMENIKARINKENNEAKLLDAELANLKKGKNQNIDDFLAQNKSTKSSSGDFLAGDTQTSSSGSGDFLSGSSNKSDDFLEGESKDDDYKIEHKGDLQAVVSSKGKVLIPFKKWQIRDYKNGIAKVSKEITSKKGECYQDYTIYIHRTGFVDASGEFLTKPVIDYIISMDWMPGVLYTISVTAAQRKRLDRERRAKEKACENQAKREAISLLQRYN